MFKRKVILEVTPVLAGNRPKYGGVFKEDASGSYQSLTERPRKLIYQGFSITSRAPHYDRVAQAIGTSMEHWGVMDTNILLWEKFSDGNAAKVTPGKIALLPIDDDSVDSNWKCLRHVHEVNGENIVFETVQDGKVVKQNGKISDIIGLAVYKIDAPQTFPSLAHD